MPALNRAGRRHRPGIAWVRGFRAFEQCSCGTVREIVVVRKRVLMDGHEALADLKQISVQIEAAVIADHGGAVLACSPDDGPTGELLSRLAREIWEAADASRRDLGRDALTQVELSTAQGSVFVVRDDRHVLLATTAPDPTVGLVFYDLKSALHALDGQSEGLEPNVVWQADAGTGAEERGNGAP
jgi:predicted regulator of Ras-like GTPase activity (Roadblock/LC7/MglB family)